MEDYGLFRVAAAVPCVKVADIDHNMKAIVGLIDKAETEGASLVVFPELICSARTCFYARRKRQWRKSWHSQEASS